MAIDQEYSAIDFRQAFAALLPPGTYWQYESGDTLDNLLDAVGCELKTVHDETKIEFETQTGDESTGWRLADYQALLDDGGVSATAYDDSAAPNLIYINIDHDQAAGELMQTLDSYRLPHTAFCFAYNNQAQLYAQAVHSNLQMNTRTLTTVSSVALAQSSFGQGALGMLTLGGANLEVNYQAVITELIPALGQSALGTITLGE